MASGKRNRARHGHAAPTKIAPLAQAALSSPHATRVVKVMRPGAPGTLRLQRRFGNALLAVRYRYDWTGLHRYTTVELLADTSPVVRGTRPEALCTVQLHPGEQELEQAVRQLGGHFDPQLRRWVIPGYVVQQLGLGDRVEFRQVIPTRHRKPR